MTNLTAQSADVYTYRVGWKDQPVWSETRQETWDELVARFSMPEVVADKDHRRAWFAGELTGGVRRNGFAYRWALTLDIDTDLDRATLGDLTTESMSGGMFKSFTHTTYSSTPQHPRARIIILLSRPITDPSEFEVVGRWACDKYTATLGLAFDKASWIPGNIMFEPCVAPGRESEYRFHVGGGEPLDVDTALAEASSAPGPNVKAVTSTGLKEVTGVTSPRGSGTDFRVVGIFAKSNRADLTHVWKEPLQEAARWPEGKADPAGRGWEQLNRDLAWAVMLGLGLDGEDLYRELLPGVMAAATGNKWTEATWVNAKDHKARQDAQNPTLSAEQGSPLPQEAVEAFNAAETFLEVDHWPTEDLRAIRAAGIVIPKPTFMSRVDGRALLYPGCTHSISAPGGSGKSMLAQWTAAEVMKAGGRVLYLDFESSPEMFLDRLQALGLADHLADQIDYVSRMKSLNHRGLEKYLARRYDFIAIDGVTAALARSGIQGESKTNSADAVVEWHDRLPRMLADSTGAAVLQVDHVSKPSRGEPADSATGSVMKANMLTGADFLLRPRVKGSREKPGQADLYFGKDRNGGLPQPDGEVPDGPTHLGRLYTTPTATGLQLVIHPPSPVPAEERETIDVRARIVQTLRVFGEMGVTDLRKEVGGNTHRVAEVLADLVEDNLVAKLGTASRPRYSLPEGLAD